MNIVCAVLGHKKGKVLSEFDNGRQHLSKCKRCGKLILFANEEHYGWTVW